MTKKKDNLRGLANQGNQELDSLFDGQTDVSNLIEDLQQAELTNTREIIKEVEVPAPIVQRDGFTIIGHFAIHPTGLEIAPEAEQSEWFAFMEWINAADTALQWIIGDWLVFGGGREWIVDQETQETEILTYEQISEMMGGRYTAGSLKQFAHTARNVSALTRVNALSFGHHRLVADLAEKEQLETLGYALENGLSVARFRRWLSDEDIDEDVPDENLHPSKRANKSWAYLQNVDRQIERGNIPSSAEVKAAKDRIHAAREWLRIMETKLDGLSSS